MISMKSIELSGKTIEFNIGDEITVKELRKVYPFLQNQTNEVEMMYNIVCALSVTENVGDIVDSLNTADFAKLGEFVGQLIEVKKK